MAEMAAVSLGAMAGVGAAGVVEGGQGARMLYTLLFGVGRCRWKYTVYWLGVARAIKRMSLSCCGIWWVVKTRLFQGTGAPVGSPRGNLPLLVFYALSG
jgi:hypothetical protein